MPPRTISDERDDCHQFQKATFSRMSSPPRRRGNMTESQFLSKPDVTNENKAQPSSAQFLTPKSARHTIHGTPYVSRSAPTAKSLCSNDGSIIWSASAAPAKITTTHGSAGILATPTKSNSVIWKPRAVMKLETLARLSKPLHSPSGSVKSPQVHGNQFQNGTSYLITKSTKDSAEEASYSSEEGLVIRSEKQKSVPHFHPRQKQSPFDNEVPKSCEWPPKAEEKEKNLRTSSQGILSTKSRSKTVKVAEPFPTIEDGDKKSDLSSQLASLRCDSSPTLTSIPKPETTRGEVSRSRSSSHDHILVLVQKVRELSEEIAKLKGKMEILRAVHEDVKGELRLKSSLLQADTFAHYQLQGKYAELEKECVHKSEIIEALQVEADDRRKDFGRVCSLANSNYTTMNSILESLTTGKQEVVQQFERFVELWGPESERVQNIEKLMTEMLEVNRHNEKVIAEKDEFIKEIKEGILRLMEEYNDEVGVGVA